LRSTPKNRPSSAFTPVATPVGRNCGERFRSPLAAPENTAASREALGLVKNQWIFFDSAVQQLRNKGADGNAPQNVASASERIQETLAAVTAQYAQDVAGAAGKSR
jgi:hypothetical protein